MLWKVENTNLKILGSVHLSNRVLPLPSQIIDVINEASIIAFESNFEFMPKMKFAHYSSPQTLSNSIPASLHADTKKLWLDLSLSEEELENLKPWWAAFRLINTLLIKNGFTSDLGIDRCVLGLAKAKKKKLFFLESVEAGLAPFANAPISEQETSLSRVVKYTAEGLQEIASIVSAWELKSPPMLLPVYERMLQLTPVTYSNALVGRNKIWLRHLLRLAKSQKNVLVVVGVLHMVGPENIQELLTEAGFTCNFVEMAR